MVAEDVKEASKQSVAEAAAAAAAAASSDGASGAASAAAAGIGPERNYSERRGLSGPSGGGAGAAAGPRLPAEVRSSSALPSDSSKRITREDIAAAKAEAEAALEEDLSRDVGTPLFSATNMLVSLPLSAVRSVPFFRCSRTSSLTQARGSAPLTGGLSSRAVRQGGQRMYRPWFLSKDQQDVIIRASLPLSTTHFVLSCTWRQACERETVSHPGFLTLARLICLSEMTIDNQSKRAYLIRKLMVRLYRSPYVPRGVACHRITSCRLSLSCDDRLTHLFLVRRGGWSSRPRPRPPPPPSVRAVPDRPRTTPRGANRRVANLSLNRYARRPHIIRKKGLVSRT